MTSRLSLDKLSTNGYSLSYQENNPKSSDISLSVFLGTGDHAFINSSYSPAPFFTQTATYSSKASSLLDSKYFNSSLSLTTLSSNQTASSAYSAAISENLSLANQTRWLLRMSPISEKIVKDNFNFTQAKQLLGSSVTQAVSSSNNIWSSNNLAKIKDISPLLLSENVSKIEFFEDSRSWSTKKMLLTLNHANYTLNFEPNPRTTLASATSSSDISAAYLLDYNLMNSLLLLPKSSLTQATKATHASSIALFNQDKTIYQDSVNNYLFNISTTTLTNNLPSYKHSCSNSNAFKFI